MELTIKTDNAEAAVSMVSEIPGVNSVKIIDDSNGEITLNLKLEHGADIREDIFNACVKNGCALLMMKATQFSLEHVFLELTKERRRVRRRIKKKVQPEAAPETAPQTTETEKEGE